MLSFWSRFIWGSSNSYCNDWTVDARCWWDVLDIVPGWENICQILIDWLLNCWTGSEIWQTVVAVQVLLVSFSLVDKIWIKRAGAGATARPKISSPRARPKISSPRARPDHFHDQEVIGIYANEDVVLYIKYVILAFASIVFAPIALQRVSFRYYTHGQMSTTSNP